MPSEYQKLQAEAKKLGIPANQKADALREAIAAAKAPKATASRADARVEIGPQPLRANEQLTITVGGLAPNEQARLRVDPEVSARMVKVDPFGEVQVIFVPRAGRHQLTIEMLGGTIQRDFDVAEQ